MRSSTTLTSETFQQIRHISCAAAFGSRVYTLMLVILFGFPACTNKLSDKAFEQKVFDEVFVKIVDSTYKDQRIYTSFPETGKWIFDKNGRIIGRDTTGQNLRDLSHARKVKTLARDTFGLNLAVGNTALINDKADLQKYNNRKFTFKHLSELPESKDLQNWIAKYPKFAGLLFLSNVKFDDKKESATLEVSYRCGMKCGLGYLVTIRKIDDKWVISNVRDTWIS